MKAAQSVFGPTRELEARFSEESGQVDLFQYMTVVEAVNEPEREISVDNVEKHKLDATLGEELGFQVFWRPEDAAFWASTGKEREKTFAELRANRPISWHRPVHNGLFEDPNDQGFWAVVRHADLVEVTRRPQDVAGAHFFSPANVMRLLEIVPTPATLGRYSPRYFEKPAARIYALANPEFRTNGYNLGFWFRFTPANLGSLVRTVARKLGPGRRRTRWGAPDPGTTPNAER